MTDIMLMPQAMEDMSCSVHMQLRRVSHTPPSEARSPSPVEATISRLRDYSESSNSILKIDNDDDEDDSAEIEVEDEDFEEEDDDDSNAKSDPIVETPRLPIRPGRLKPAPGKPSTSSQGSCETEPEPVPELTVDSTLTSTISLEREDNCRSSNAERNLMKLKKLHELDRICTIGTGTFGRVYLCKQPQSRQYRALKAMSISEVVQNDQVEHVFSEKRILETLDHPFTITMHWACHDDHHLYMLFDYIPGGELFSYLRTMGYFSAPVGRFYASEIILALEYLHNKSTIYRDLKPENLLLSRDGHLKITDFGFAKQFDDREDRKTWTLCGTPEYLAPELIQNEGHDQAVDWWALGVLVFEMLAGYPPFYGNNQMEIYKRVLAGKIKFPKYVDATPKDLIRKMLILDRSKRLGNMEGGSEDIKKHKWFNPIDWSEVLNRTVKPPIIPKVTHDGDPGNYDEYEEEDWKTASCALPEEIEAFADW